jgi:hypothetical protein
MNIFYMCGSVLFLSLVVTNTLFKLKKFASIYCLPAATVPVHKLKEPRDAVPASFDATQLATEQMRPVDRSALIDKNPAPALIRCM